MLYVLPDGATFGQLKTGYIVRGAQVVACNSKRDLAVQVHAGEHADEAEWRKRRVLRNCPWWRFGLCGV